MIRLSLSVLCAVLVACGPVVDDDVVDAGVDAAPDVVVDHPCRPYVDYMADGGLWCSYDGDDAGIVPASSRDGCASCYLVQCHADGTAPSYLRVECSSFGDGV